MELDSPSRVLMGVAGWLVAFVGAWAAIHNNGTAVRFSGGIGSAFSASARRFWGIVVMLFGASLVVGSVLA